MSFNQQDLSEQTSDSQTPGNETSYNGQSALDASQDSSIQNSNTQTPTTKQPPTLPTLTATCGVPSHPGPFSSGPHYPSNDNSRSNNNAAPPNWSHSLSNPFGHNPNYPWNNNSVPAPPSPHPAVASATAHLPAAGYLPSTFTPGPVSARNQGLMNGSTPLEPCSQQPRLPNPLGPVGVQRPAYRQ